MKFHAVLIALAAGVAIAAPSPVEVANTPEAANTAEAADMAASATGSGDFETQHDWFPPHQECRPGSYSCTWNNRGWRVCDWSGHWVFGGWCGWSQTCTYNWQNQSPYCVPRRTW
ncbi:hypothetical protein MMYC01_204974 [Madurella mycetomatis]|uniref:Uncharacterized protein n=1 Tax=Madurella mycetomatis TaxID=100816 RepID=A0A175VX00_9PEZI|nr:hypothetical protein MMYC01_208267 [Madurella mycetomatis]KXX80049.1 hypothetical protein MMYC01_204974 [Madurella mycetomatis]